MSTANTSKKQRSTARKALLLFVLPVAAYYGIFRFKSHKLEAAIQSRVAAYHAAGEPVTIADLCTTPVPDQDNAVIELRQAASMLTGPASDNSAWGRYDQGDRGYPMTSKERPLAKHALQDNAAVFGWVDKAMAKRGFYWPSQPTSPLIEFLLPDLASQRHLACFLDMDAMVEHDDGHDAAAVADIRRILFVGHALEHHPQMMVVELVANGMRGLACNVVRKIGPHLTVGTSPDEASPTALTELIHELLDEEEATRKFRIAILSERVFYLDTADALASGRLDNSKLSGASQPGASSSSLESWVNRHFQEPPMRGDLPILLDAASDAGKAVMCSDWPSAQVMLGNSQSALGTYTSKHFFARMLMPSFSRAIEAHFRTEADCRTAATMLAIRWFEADHSGDLPPALEALVPKYLPAVPRDPFTLGAALRYIASGADPRIYTLCPDGTDNGGHERDTTGKQFNSYHRPAAIAHLRPQPRDLSQLPAELKD